MVLVTTLKFFFFQVHIHICTTRVMCMCVICKQTLNVHVFPKNQDEFDDNMMWFVVETDFD